MHHYQNKRDTPGDFFPMPKAAFRLGLDSGEIAVLAFLMYCEDRKTYQCHPSYSTIGSAVGMSNNTVKKYVDRLEHKGFILTEPTMVKTRDGRAHNGSLLYTLQPIQPIEEAYFERQLREAEAKMHFNKLTVTESLPKSRAISFAIFVWLWTKSLDMPSMNTPSI